MLSQAEKAQSFLRQSISFALRIKPFYYPHTLFLLDRLPACINLDMLDNWGTNLVYRSVLDFVNLVKLR